MSNDAKVVEASGLLAPQVEPNPFYLDVVQRGNHIALQRVVGVDVAVLDTTTAKALGAVEELEGAQFECFVTAEDLAAALNQHKGGDKGVVFALHIIFYGPPGARTEIDRILSPAHLYLQDPSYTRLSYLRYDNPHVLLFAGDSSTTVPTHLSLHKSPEVETLLENLDHQQELEQRDVSDIVTSSLQK